MKEARKFQRDTFQEFFRGKLFYSVRVLAEESLGTFNAMQTDSLVIWYIFHRW